MSKCIEFKEMCKKNIKVEDLTDDVEIVLTERHPKYIIEPFHVVFPGDPEYDHGITINDIMSMIQ